VSRWAVYVDREVARSTSSCAVDEKAPKICKMKFSELRAVLLLILGD